MNTDRNKGIIIGILLLISFILGIVIYQVLQGPVLFAKDFLTITSENSNEIITSTILGLANGTITIIIAVLLLPIFKKFNYSLAFLYLSFAVINFAMIAIDNVSALSILELSKEYLISGKNNTEYYETIGQLFYKRHWWTHYMSLLNSGFYLFLLYYLFYRSKAIPGILSISGIVAVSLMLIEIMSSIFGHSINMLLMLPLGIVQISLAIWLLTKGLKVSDNLK